MAAGTRCIPPEVARLLREQAAEPVLTDRQKKILGLIADGVPNKLLADRFGISLDGIKGHVRRICAKIGAANRAEAVAIALRKNLLKD